MINRLSLLFKHCIATSKDYFEFIDMKIFLTKLCEVIFEIKYSPHKEHINYMLNGKFDQFKSQYIGTMELQCLINPKSLNDAIENVLRCIKDNRKPRLSMDVDENFISDIIPSGRDIIKEMGFQEIENNDSYDEDYLFHHDPYFVITYYDTYIHDMAKIIENILNNFNPTPREFYLVKYK